jgi:hypothetical protein
MRVFLIAMKALLNPCEKKNLGAKMRGSIVHIEAAGREVRR